MQTAASRSSRFLIWAILIVGLTIRLGWGLSRPVDAASIERLPDQREYLELGRSLLHSDRLSMVDPRFNDLVYAFRMPGYPAFIAACGGNVKIVRGVQALIDTSTVLAIFWLARWWFSPRLSCLAAAIVAVDPLFVYFSGLILSETLFASLLAWGMACLVHGASPIVRATVRDRIVWFTGVGLLLASIYVRPSALPFPLALIAAALVVEARAGVFQFARRVPVLTLVAIATFAVLVPWAIRNRALVGQLVYTTTNDGFTLYDGFNPDADGSSNQSWTDRLPLLTNLTEMERSNYLRDRALSFAREQPWRAISLIPARLKRTWSPVPLSDEYGSKRLYVIAAAGHAVPLFLLAIVGLFNASVPRSARMYLIVPALLITVIQGASVGSLRYRMPIQAPMAVLAAAAFVRRERVPPVMD